MFRAALVPCLVCTLLLHSGLSASVLGLPRQSSRTSQLKIEILQIPAGVIVEVRLKNGAKLKGVIETVNDSNLVLSVERGKRSESLAISFDQVKSVKKKGNNALRNILIGVGVFAGALFAFFAIFKAVAD